MEYLIWMTYPEIEVCLFVADVILENAQEGKQMIIAAAYPPDCINDVLGCVKQFFPRKKFAWAYIAGYALITLLRDWRARQQQMQEF